MHMKQLKMLFQVIQISSLNKGVLNSYKNFLFLLVISLFFEDANDLTVKRSTSLQRYVLRHEHLQFF